MGLLDNLWMLLAHPEDVRSLVQYKLYHEPKRDITNPEEFSTSGYDRKSMKRCWYFLDMTSRSFAAVIKELEGDLARAVALFYLVLRGLDTIEDDMTIPDDVKQPLLRSFYEKCTTPGWCYGGNGPGEKDRQLLVEFYVVVEELERIDPPARQVILDIAREMGTGMADFAHKAIEAPDGVYIDNQEEFDLYCHYVAGLVGEGLSRLFAATKKEQPMIANELVLSNSFGLLLQKTNILRDIREDVDDARFFWPRSVWSKHGFAHPTDLRLPERREEALWVLSAMTLDALRHCTDALDYLSLLRNQTVFNFCAIPAVMAIATLEVCFMNSDVFEKNVKIRKAEAVRILMRSTNPRDVAYMVRNYARQLHQKSVPSDPYFLKISVMCGKIEQWCEHHYPSFIQVGKGPGSDVSQGVLNDARLRIVMRNEQLLKAKNVREGVQSAAADDMPLQQWQIFGAVGGLILLVGLAGFGIVMAAVKIFDLK